MLRFSLLKLRRYASVNPVSFGSFWFVLALSLLFRSCKMPLYDAIQLLHFAPLCAASSLKIVTLCNASEARIVSLCFGSASSICDAMRRFESVNFHVSTCKMLRYASVHLSIFPLQLPKTLVKATLYEQPSYKQ
jgi:hypothetical protein